MSWFNKDKNDVSKSEKESDGAVVWNNIVSDVMKVPGVKKSRAEVLRELLGTQTDCEFSKLACIIDQNQSPTVILPAETIDKISNKVIASHTLKVTAISAAAGMPGGLAMAATIPADLAQYFYHVFAVAQKLGYLYGFPSLLDERGEITEDGISLLTVFVGIMMGVAVTNELINVLSARLAQQAGKKLAQQALTKTAWYPIVKKIGRMIGVKVTKDSVSKSIGKLIPLIGGVISGGLTYVTFKPSAEKLKRTLQEWAVKNDKRLSRQNKYNKIGIVVFGH